MNDVFELDFGDLARISNQLPDDDLFAEDRDDEAGLWLEDWNEYLGQFYEQDESAYRATTGCHGPLR